MYGYACFGTVGLDKILCAAARVLNILVPILVALAVVVFIWGIIRYVIADSEEMKKKGKNTIIFGLIGLAVIVALWGLVYVLVDTFQIDSYAPRSYELNDWLLPR